MAFDENDIQDSLRTVRKLLKTMPTDASAHDVHRFRTNSRRIEALLPALSLDSGSNAKHMLKQTSKLRRQAGKVRDMDVLSAYVSDMPKQGTKRLRSLAFTCLNISELSVGSKPRSFTR